MEPRRRSGCSQAPASGRGETDDAGGAGATNEGNLGKDQRQDNREMATIGPRLLLPLQIARATGFLTANRMKARPKAATLQEIAIRMKQRRPHFFCTRRDRRLATAGSSVRYMRMRAYALSDRAINFHEDHAAQVPPKMDAVGTIGEHETSITQHAEHDRNKSFNAGARFGPRRSKQPIMSKAFNQSRRNNQRRPVEPSSS